MTTERRVAIVTGGNRGIGRAIALTLAAQGMDVVVSALSLSEERYGEALTAASVPDEIRALGVRGLGVEGDLRRRSAAKALVEQTLDIFGRIDVLVNNAGGAISPIKRSKASVAPDEDFDDMLALNLMSVVRCCQEALPSMRARGSGSIVNIASQAAIAPGAGGGRLAPYGVAKAGVVQYTRFLAAEVGKDGIRVNCVAPGVITSGRVVAESQARGLGTADQVQAVPLRRLGTPEDVARAVQFFATDLSAYITGQCLSVCGGAVLTPS